MATKSAAKSKGKQAAPTKKAAPKPASAPSRVPHAPPTKPPPSPRSAGGRAGFIWHYHDKHFTKEAIPLDVPRVAGGQLPGFFKAWGAGDEVWVVGAGGAILHRKGAAPFAVVPSGYDAA